MDFRVKCCECNRVRVKGQWLRDDGAMSQNVMFSHGYCPDCLKRIMTSIEAWDPRADIDQQRVSLNLHPVLDG